MNWKWLKYFLAYLTPLSVFAGMVLGGYFPFLPLAFSFICVPLIELLFKPDPYNLNAIESEMVQIDPSYDFLLYMLLPLQFIILCFFLFNTSSEVVPPMELFGKTLSMGILCGIIGINVGHELGHRKGKTDLFLASLFLLTSLYMYFNIEHNKGHHKRVGTHADPASARFGENIYHFWIRSVVQGYFSAWRIENERLKSINRPVLSFYNQMIRIHIIQLLFLGIIYLLFGWKSLLLFMAAAVIGILLLESVNYIEHYGIGRRPGVNHTYSRALPCHSWNSDHVLSRILLFELSRHSDHHYKASKKYQLLDHHDDSPQMPTGYAGMILLALVPPLWFKVMHPLIEREMERFPQMVRAV